MDDLNYILDELNEMLLNILYGIALFSAIVFLASIIVVWVWVCWKLTTG